MELLVFAAVLVAMVPLPMQIGRVIRRWVDDRALLTRRRCEWISLIGCTWSLVLEIWGMIICVDGVERNLPVIDGTLMALPIPVLCLFLGFALPSDSDPPRRKRRRKVEWSPEDFLPALPIPA